MILPRVAVLAGAGLVKDAGVPISSELVERLRETLKYHAYDDLTVSHEERAEARRRLALYRFLDGGIRFQEGAQDRDPYHDLNIEQIANAALELEVRAENPLTPYASGWHPRLIELEQQSPVVLRDFVDFIYFKLSKWLTVEEPGKVSYLGTLKDICNLKVGLDIFSLNYDLCIETALSGFKTEFHNGFTEDGWRPQQLSPEDCRIRLFKLHGSLDWSEHEVYGVCSFRFPRHKDAEEFEIDSKPLLIFGTNHKLTATEPFLSLAYQFSQSVLTTSVICVIGYSFADAYINEILWQGMKRNPKLRMIVVSPDADKQVPKQPLLHKNPKVRIIPLKAKEALTSGDVFRGIEECLKTTVDDTAF